MVCGWCGEPWDLGHECDPLEHGWVVVREYEGIQVLRKKKNENA